VKKGQRKSRGHGGKEGTGSCTSTGPSGGGHVLEGKAICKGLYGLTWVCHGRKSEIDMCGWNGTREGRRTFQLDERARNQDYERFWWKTMWQALRQARHMEQIWRKAQYGGSCVS